MKTAVLVVHGIGDQKPGETVRAVANMVEDNLTLSTRQLRAESVDGKIGEPFEAAIARGTTATFHELYWADVSRRGTGLLSMARSLVAVLDAAPGPSIVALKERKLATALAIAHATLIGVVLPLIYCGLGAALAIPLFAAAANDAGTTATLNGTWESPSVWRLATSAACALVAGISAQWAIGPRVAPTTRFALAALVSLIVCVTSVASRDALAWVIAGAFSIAWVALAQKLFVVLSDYGVPAWTRRADVPAFLHGLSSEPCRVVHLGLLLAAIFATLRAESYWEVGASLIFTGGATVITWLATDRVGSMRRVQRQWWATAVSFAVFFVSRRVFADPLGSSVDAMQTAYVATTSAFAVVAALIVGCALLALLMKERPPADAQDAPVVFSRAEVRTALLAVAAPPVLLLAVTSPLLSGVAYLVHKSELTVLVSPDPTRHPVNRLPALCVYGESLDEHRTHASPDFDRALASPLASSPERDLRAECRGRNADPSLMMVAMARATGTSMASTIFATQAALVGYLVLVLTTHLRRAAADSKRHASSSTWMDTVARHALFVAGAFFFVTLTWICFGYLIEVLFWLFPEGLGTFRRQRAEESGAAVAALGASLAGSAVLLAFPERLKGLLASAWPVLDLISDVAAYLRTEKPIRRRLMARLARLISVIREEKPDRLIIVAHSQGSAIVYDYLRTHGGANVGGDVVLVTCGSPLRHFYARMFPGDYGDVERDFLAPGGIANCWVNASTIDDHVGMCLTETGVNELRLDDESGHTRYWHSRKLARALRLLLA